MCSFPVNRYCCLLKSNMDCKITLFTSNIRYVAVFYVLF